MTGPQPPAGRRRRRAVGPVGARPAGAVEDLDVARQPAETEERPVDDDERLRREVPPHHGT